MKALFMSGILKKVEDFIEDLFKKKLSPDLKYHDLSHTKNVVEAAKDIGKNSGLTEDELEMLLLAAWFHDSGFTEIYTGHEEISIKICSNFLRLHNYPEEKIEKVNSIIKTTIVSSIPDNLIEMVIKDADISYMGKKIFFTKSLGLRHEWDKYLGKQYSEDEWLQNNIDFLSANKFYTPYANKIFKEQKQINLNKLKKQLEPK